MRSAVSEKLVVSREFYRSRASDSVKGHSFFETLSSQRHHSLFDVEALRSPRDLAEAHAFDRPLLGLFSFFHAALSHVYARLFLATCSDL